LGTHAPYSLLPYSLKTSKCPIVYICREPKDILVSFWNMFKTLGWMMEQVPFAEAFELFCKGQVPYGPIWDHMLEYYMKNMHSPDKILFLKYEEMMSNPIDGVIRLAKFIGYPFSEEEFKKGLVEEIVSFCSFNKQKNLDVNKTNGIISGAKNDYFFRKAVIGDWQNYMTAEMAAKLDEISNEKLHGSIFTY
jgi:Sulfotransferase domain